MMSVDALYEMPRCPLQPQRSRRPRPCAAVLVRPSPLPSSPLKGGIEMNHSSRDIRHGITRLKSTKSHHS